MPITRKSSPSSLRIIGGQWRSRKLAFPAIEGLRPTGDRIRETLFNWLQDDIVGIRCLDLFAGSGALGFEAVSRGAAHAFLLERHPSAVQQLQANADLLKTRAITIKPADAMQFLAGPSHEQFQLVFVDPPFALRLWEPVCQRLDEGKWLAPGAWIYVEFSADQALVMPSSWRLHRQKQAGNTAYCLYQAATDS